MSELRIETFTMPGADLGPENPLPPFRATRDALLMAEMPGLPADMRDSIVWGQPRTILPYTVQDGYNRRRRPREFRVAVLENEFLRATFLLELGGRLWSLVHMPTGRELLAVNSVFQPANLALRNAWFSGGVEWNIGAIGHSPFTCSPLFAARVEGPAGTPVLRLYEYERIRRVPFQVDAYLPDGSPVLFVRVRITNPHDQAIPMYWWSNIAVPETQDTRVVAPADSAYSHGNRGEVTVTPVPLSDGIDVTYASHLLSSSSIFFRIPAGQQPWITALDRTGQGLVQTSTGRLPGRKLFAWGMGPGGHRWQEFLSAGGTSVYIEIQAGLAPTQMQYATMPAGADWSWVEAYGLLEADAPAVHGKDWDAAQAAAGVALGRLIPMAELRAEHARGAAWADRPPAEIYQRGSGWGALERVRRKAAGEPPLCGPGLAFDDASLGPEQIRWLKLLRGGAMPGVVPATEPCGVVIDEGWRRLLEESLAGGKGDGWQAWYDLGVMRQHAGESSAACDAYHRSLALAETPWALRALALVSLDEGRHEEAARFYTAAVRLRPDLSPLVVECGRALIEAGQPQTWLDLLVTIPAGVRSTGRVRLLEGQAALAVGDLKQVEQILTARADVDDLREGELSLSELWFSYHEARLSREEGVPMSETLRARVRREFPVPEHMDFRMRAE